MSGNIEMISKIMENGLSISATMANMCYSVDGEGGNHLAKILAKKCSGKLYEVTEKLHIPVFEEEKLEEIKGDILQASQVKEKLGKGYRYPVIGHMLELDTEIRGDRSCFLWRGIKESLRGLRLCTKKTVARLP